MKLAFLFASILSISASFGYADEAYDYQIKGMKCGDCVEQIQAGVCSMPGVDKCSVEVGKMIITPKPGVQLDQKAIAAAVKGAGHYSVQSFKKVTTAAPAAPSTTETKK